MMNKKSKDSHEKENTNLQSSKHSFTPFTNLRKSFKRLKQRREQRAKSVDSILDKENSKNVNKDTSINKRLTVKNDNSQNLLRRIASGKRFRRKNVQSVIASVEEIRRFNVVEWSSCESLSDNFEKKVQKHNSLRRSKASLLMPVSGNLNGYDKFSPPCTKITRYSSMNAINDQNNKIKINNEWYSSQQNVSAIVSGSNNNNYFSKHKADKNLNCEKRKRPNRSKRESLSLPNICEDNLNESSVEIEENDSDSNNEHSITETKPPHRFSIESLFTANNNNNRQSFKRFSVVALTENQKDLLYGSSPVLDRPPVPSAPKPTSRRNRVLRKSVSTEAISPRKRRADNASFKFDKRTLSEYNIHRDNSDQSKEDLITGCLQLESKKKTSIQNSVQEMEPLVKEQGNELQSQSLEDIKRSFSLCASMNDLPSFISELNEKIWKQSMASYELPLAIAEAVWDHTSLNNDELTFSSGDVIAVLFTGDENWWWGARGNDEGWFPASYVRLRVVQELDDDLPTVTAHNGKTQQRMLLDDNKLNANDEHTFIVPRKASVLSVMGMQELANQNNKDEHAKTVRAKCVEELLNTEKDYVKMLKNIIEGYLQKVREEKNLFTPSDAEVIFGNIEELYKFHQDFLTDLQKNIKMDKMEESVVGHVFLKHKNGFEIYSKYCNNQPRSSARISTLTKEKKRELFFETCRLRQNMIRLSMDGFLLAPVQRICKYPLQLKELLKHTSTEHVDYKTLLEARMTMQNVASLINERKRRLENVNKLARWQLTISNWKGDNVVMKSSDLLLKGALTKITDGRQTERFCYLFDHQLIYFLKETNNKRHPLSYRGRIDLDTAIIENLDNNHVMSKGEPVRHSWRLWNESKRKWCYFSADSAEKKESWIKALENEREHVKEEQSKGFVVLPEIRLAAIDIATAKHSIGIKRGRIRRKSICTNHPELETTFGAPLVPPLVRQMTVAAINTTPSVDVSTVTKRPNKPRRNKSFRWSLNSNIFDKYF